MAKKKQKLFYCKTPDSPEEKEIIAREIALLKILEGQLTYRIPRIDKTYPFKYMFSYRPLPGIPLTSIFYQKLSNIQKTRLAKDIATFAYKLHETIPVQFAQAIGFTVTSWPLNPTTLKQNLLSILDTKMRAFFEHFLEAYTHMLAQPYTPVLLHHDLHGANILVDQYSGRLKSIIDFEDAAIGDPYQEFRLLYSIDARLMEEAAFFYAKMKKEHFNIQRIHLYYLATEYSRLVEIIQGVKKEYSMPDLLKRIADYEKIYKRVPKKQRQTQFGV